MVYHYNEIAQENNLIRTGGSDFHGSFNQGIELGKGKGDLNVDYKVFKGLKKALEGPAADYKSLEYNIGHTFKTISFLERALCHRSYLNENQDSDLRDNERLEFLGDAVLGLLANEFLYQRFPDRSEGDLTKMKSLLVCGARLSEVATQVDLGIHVRMSRSEAATGGRQRPTILADTTEALIGAVYLDGGLDAAASFILRMFADWLDKAEADGPQGNYKSLLQQHSQDCFGVTPSYVLLDEKGPDHNKCFETEVVLRERHFRSAWGVTKKEAEQRAAYNALVDLGIVETSMSED